MKTAHGDSRKQLEAIIRHAEILELFTSAYDLVKFQLHEHSHIYLDIFRIQCMLYFMHLPRFTRQATKGEPPSQAVPQCNNS